VNSNDGAPKETTPEADEEARENKRKSRASMMLVDRMLTEAKSRKEERKTR